MSALREHKGGRGRPYSVRLPAPLNRRIDVPLVLIALAGFAVLTTYTWRVSEWFVMTDELQHMRVAIAVGDRLSPLPSIHGEPYSALSMLYPLITAPLYQLFDMPTAFRAVHLLNGALMASAAVPSYLLTRSVVSSRWAARLVAALTIAVPWVAMSLMVMTESAAYPAFLWAMLAIQRSVVEPGFKRDALAIAAIVVAFFARTQFVVLALVLPLVILLHELRFGGLRASLKRVIVGHKLLVAAASLSALMGVALLAAGRLGDVLGSYEVTTTEGELLPPGIHRAVGVHLDFVLVAVGVLPFLLTAAWVGLTLARPLDRRAHAFALLAVSTTLLLAYEVASFNLRFANGGVQERYFFYVAPLLFVGMAAFLLDPRRTRALALAVAGAGLVLLLGLADFAPTAGPFFASPASAFHNALDGQSWRLGERLGIADLSPVTVITVASVLATAMLATAIAVRRPSPRWLRVGVAGMVTGFCVVETLYTLDRVADSGNGTRPGITDRPLESRDWVDSGVTGGSAALVPSAEGTFPVQGLWWETELFNKHVSESWSVDGSATYTPFPAREVRLDFATGALRDVGRRTRFLVVSATDLRFRLAAARVIGRQGELMLLEPTWPPRAEWATRGIDGSGALLTSPARVRLFAGDAGKNRLAGVELTLSAAPGSRPTGYQLDVGDRRLSGEVPSGKAKRLRVDVCIPARGFTDAAVRTSDRVALKKRHLALTSVDTRRLGRPCPTS